MNNNKYQNFFLVAFVLILEVTIFFNSIELPIPRVIPLMTLLVLIFVFFANNKKINIRIISVLIITVSLIIIQGLFFGISITTVFTFPLFKFFIPYLLYKIVGESIFEYLVNVIFYSALFCSFIWLIQIIVPPFDNILQSLRFATDHPLISGTEDNYRVSIGMIYTISHWPIDLFGIEILRNAGLYHEPGAFAYFLILAIGLNTIIEKRFANTKNIIMSIILLTTFSTAGYLAYFVLLTFVIVQSDIQTHLKVLTVPLFFIAAYVSFTQLDFMADKILDQYETQIDNDAVFENEGGRVRRIRSAIYLLSTSPIIGRGIISASREFDFGSPYHFTGAGIWRVLPSYGIILAPIIYIIYILGIRKICRQYNSNNSIAYFIFIAIAIGATSQRFFMDNITLLLFINGLMINHINILPEKNEIRNEGNCIDS